MASVFALRLEQIWSFLISISHLCSCALHRHLSLFLIDSFETETAEIILNYKFRSMSRQIKRIKNCPCIVFMLIYCSQALICKFVFRATLLIGWVRCDFWSRLNTASHLTESCLAIFQASLTSSFSHRHWPMIRMDLSILHVLFLRCEITESILTSSRQNCSRVNLGSCPLPASVYAH